MSKRKILICDDEAEMLNYLRKMLAGNGFAVEIFAAGQSLLAYLDAGGEADLLLQDVRMPDMVI